jgi:acyl dehydratase
MTQDERLAELRVTHITSEENVHIGSTGHQLTFNNVTYHKPVLFGHTIAL